MDLCYTAKSAVSTKCLSSSHEFMRKETKLTRAHVRTYLIENTGMCKIMVGHLKFRVLSRSQVGE